VGVSEESAEFWFGKLGRRTQVPYEDNAIGTDMLMEVWASINTFNGGVWGDQRLIKSNVLPSFFPREASIH